VPLACPVGARLLSGERIIPPWLLALTSDSDRPVKRRKKKLPKNASVPKAISFNHKKSVKFIALRYHLASL